MVVPYVGAIRNSIKKVSFLNISFFTANVNSPNNLNYTLYYLIEPRGVFGIDGIQQAEYMDRQT